MYVRPFGPRAAWNIPVKGLPVSPHSALYVQHLWAGSPYPGEIHTYTDGYTYPVYDEANSTITVAIHVTHPEWGSNLIGKTIRWNPAWKAAAGSDAQAIVVDSGMGKEWDLWQAKLSSDHKTLSIGNGNRIPGSYWIKEDGFPGSRGCGIEYLAMLVRPEEVAQGVIEHALSMPIGDVQSPPVLPATKSDAHRGYIPMGTRFALKITDAQIKAWTDSLPLSAAGKGSARVIAVALRDYGAFVTDNGGQATVQLEDVKSAGTKWKALGLGPINVGGRDFPNRLLNGLITPSRLYAIVPSNEYPSSASVGLTINVAH